ncbi:MAG: cobalt ECF transporter T component CbiQ [Candidatus Omnitrophota bacterium]
MAISSALWESFCIFLAGKHKLKKMHLPEIDKYSYLKSVFHSWDPRLKLISFSLLILSIALISDILPACAGFILAIIFVLLSRIPVYFVLRNLKWVVFFALTFFIIIPLTVPGEILIRVGFLNISRQGIRLAFLIALRAISICMLIFPMIGTMRFHVTLKALSRLGIPDKLIQMIMFTYRYIFVFIEEVRRLLIASQARLFRKRTNVFTLRITGNLIGMLFIRGFERTQCVYNAMASRGYKGNLQILDEFKRSGWDFVKACLIMTAAIMLSLTGFML